MIARLKESRARQEEATFERLKRLNAGLEPESIRRYLGKEFVEDSDERIRVLFCVERDK